MKISIKSMAHVLTLTVLMMLISLEHLLAQTPPPPPATPIDGGLALLLAGGVAYGIQKVRKGKRND